MGRLFGTDGIRGIYNQHPITQETAFKLGRSMVRFCESRKSRPDVIIGRDTRSSGKVLEYALVSGLLSAGGKALLAGVLPTPGVAFLTRKLCGGAGIVLSASHNPQEYNGFKVFSSEGYKLSEAEESEIETLIFEESGPSHLGSTGQVEVLDEARDMYISFLSETLSERLSGIKIVIDCSNGATYRVAPALFEGLGLETEALFNEPDGRNINEECGSQHTEALSRRVLESNADLGLAFDGDGDRLIAVDERGSVLTGDQILMICARMLKDRGVLKNGVVVSTVMSNMGLGAALKEHGLEHITTPVGDRNVMEEMKSRMCCLGGEDSGHIIFSDFHTTGDGMLTALQLLSAMGTSKSPLSRLSTLMRIYPQTLINVPVKKRPDIHEVPELAGVIETAETDLGDDGRVLVRYSGTEPLCRVMVEGKDREKTEETAKRIAAVIDKELNR